jgi:hypothetical protein
MKFKDLPNGSRFVVDDAVYIKVPPYENCYGETINATDTDGCGAEIPANQEVGDITPTRDPIEVHSLTVHDGCNWFNCGWDWDPVTFVAITREEAVQRFFRAVPDWFWDKWDQGKKYKGREDLFVQEFDKVIDEWDEVRFIEDTHRV